jgi:tetratricopeptide (TPR) repeat protein
MQRISRSHFAFVLIVLLAFASAGCNKLKARDFLNKGVAAYKAGNFDRAIEMFKQAKEADPTLLNAQLYLATAYASQYIPGAPSEDNVSKGKQAIEEFQGVLHVDANNLSAIDGIGSILYNMAGSPFDEKKMVESRSYHEKHIQIDPSAKEPYYWVGVINWTMSWRANQTMRKAWNEANSRKTVKDEQPMPDKVRAEFQEKYGAIVEDGIKQLKQAIVVAPDYEDAMAYLNLLYRQRADMAASPQEREEYLTQADSLVDKVKEIKQKKSEAAAAQPQ